MAETHLDGNVQRLRVTPRYETIDLSTRALVANEHDATRVRVRLAALGALGVNLIGSPGAGKTTLTGAVLRELARRGRRAAALVGDCATDADGRRLAGTGAWVRQLIVGEACHLEAHMIVDALGGFDDDLLDVLLIENVGNLVCPAGFDLGEAERWVCVSVTEGEDKPRKYPATFATADVVVVTKFDLVDASGVDLDELRAAIADAAPAAATYEVSARTGEGVAELVDRLDRGAGEEG